MKLHEILRLHQKLIILKRFDDKLDLCAVEALDEAFFNVPQREIIISMRQGIRRVLEQAYRQNSIDYFGANRKS